MIQNKVEVHAQESYEQLKGHFQGFCGCPVCHADVLVYALNRLPARYVASREGTVITELSLDKHQNRATIDDSRRRADEAARTPDKVESRVESEKAAATAGVRDPKGAAERASGEAIDRAASESIEEHRVTINADDDGIDGDVS